MIVNTQQIQVGITNYIENELAKKAPGFTKFAIYFMLPSIISKTNNMLANFKENEFTKEFFDEKGNIKIDEVYNSAKQAIVKSGQIVVYGIIFNESDIDKLYNYIASATA